MRRRYRAGAEGGPGHPGRRTAVDGQHDAGDVRALVAAQEQHRVRDVPRVAHPAEQVEAGAHVVGDRADRRLHRRRDDAREHRVDAHVVAPVRAGEVDRQAELRGLRRAVRGVRRTRVANGRDRADVHDRAAAAIDQRRDRELGGQERAGEVHADDLLVELERGLGDRRRGARSPRCSRGCRGRRSARARPAPSPRSRPRS